MTEYRLGKSIAQILPFHRIPIEKKQQQKEIITTKLVITIAISDSKNCCFNDMNNK